MRLIAGLAIVTLVASHASAQSVDLQASTPGVPQGGHLNIMGTAIAGTFSGSGSGLTGVPWSSLTGVPAGFADNADNGLVFGSGYLVNSSFDLMDVTQLGMGRVADFVIVNPQNGKEAVYAGSAGTGRGLRVLCDGANTIGAASIEWKPSVAYNGGSALYVDSSGYLGVNVNATGSRGVHIGHNPSKSSLGAGLNVSSRSGGNALVTYDYDGGWAIAAHGQNGTVKSNGGYFSSPVGTVALTAGGGTKNGVVPTSKGARLLYAEEATEVWFTDYGFGELSNGFARVDIDALFAETVDLTQPYHVFVQLNDARSNGVAVERKTAASFEVVELGHGASDAEFSYRVVAKRKGYADDRLVRMPDAENDPNVYPRGFVEGVVPVVE